MIWISPDGTEYSLQTVILPLRHTIISESDIETLSEVLKENKYIKTLSLEHSLIGDEGTVLLSEVFKKNQMIDKIYLSNNDIGDDGIIALADALKVCWWIRLVGF